MAVGTWVKGVAVLVTAAVCSKAQPERSFHYLSPPWASRDARESCNFHAWRATLPQPSLRVVWQQPIEQRQSPVLF